MERKPKAIWSVCAAFTGFRVLLLILDYLDFKYLIPQNTALNETVRKLLTIGKVQYDIAIFLTSIIDSANIQRTLIQPVERRIVIVSLRVSDGGASRVSELNTFFNRFELDPKTFAVMLKETA